MEPRRSRALVLLAVAVAVAWGGWLRVRAAGAEVWLDEILSWQLARQAGSVVGVFAVKSDNNHHLNTMWLATCPDGGPWGWYRLHSLAAGVGAIAVAAGFVRWRGEADRAFAAVLLAACPWLVFASAEARGYSLAVLLALAAFGFLQRYLDDRRWRWLVGFWVACALAFLGHLSFVHAYLGFVVWSLRRFARERRYPGEELRKLVVCHGGVAMFFAPFYLLCVRGMQVEGAPPSPVWPVVERLLVVGLGGPADSPWAWAYLIAVAALVVAGVALLAREKDDGWVFFVVAVVASPAVFLARRPPFVFERYFLISYVFFLLLAAQVLGHLWRQRWRLPVLVAVAIVLVGGYQRVAEFTDGQRGRFHDALAWLAEHAPPGQIRVTGDNDFRVGAYVAFYRHYWPGREWEYVTTDDADWLIVHRLPGEPEPDEAVEVAGRPYRQQLRYPSGGRAALGWYLYRRAKE